jgi:hypothetical protein
MVIQTCSRHGNFRKQTRRTSHSDIMIGFGRINRSIQFQSKNNIMHEEVRFNSLSLIEIKFDAFYETYYVMGFKGAVVRSKSPDVSKK